jgi:hypothetical protein
MALVDLTAHMVYTSVASRGFDGHEITNKAMQKLSSLLTVDTSIYLCTKQTHDLGPVNERHLCLAFLR